MEQYVTKEEHDDAILSIAGKLVDLQNQINMAQSN